MFFFLSQFILLPSNVVLFYPREVKWTVKKIKNTLQEDNLNNNKITEK
jgi:hypothetical protein